MLQATTKKGKFITPAAYSLKKIEELKKSQQSFYCPVCKERVILRAGPKVIAHFAHKAKTNCLSAKGEGAYHEKGKLMIYQWLLNQGITAYLEKYLPEINRRPDIYLELKEKVIAIEYQCAQISNQEIIERTQDYQELGIHVIWILGENQFKRISNHIMKVNRFSKSLIHQFSSQYPITLFYFCPLQARFIKYQDFHFLSTQRTTGKLTIMKQNQVNLKQLLHGKTVLKHDLLRVWQIEKEKFRTLPKSRRFGKEFAWQQWLYLKKLHPEKLPSYIYLPVQGELFMKTGSWIWQSRLVIDLIAPLRIGDIITSSRCTYYLQQYMENNKNYPLITPHHDPVSKYLQILSQIGVLEKISDQHYLKKQEIEMHPTIELALEADKILLQQLILS